MSLGFVCFWGRASGISWISTLRLFPSRSPLVWNPIERVVNLALLQIEVLAFIKTSEKGEARRIRWVKLNVIYGFWGGQHGGGFRATDIESTSTFLSLHLMKLSFISCNCEDQNLGQIDTNFLVLPRLLSKYRSVKKVPHGISANLRPTPITTPSLYQSAEHLVILSRFPSFHWHVASNSFLLPFFIVVAAWRTWHERGNVFLFKPEVTRIIIDKFSLLKNIVNKIYAHISFPFWLRNKMQIACFLITFIVLLGLGLNRIL